MENKVSVKVDSDGKATVKIGDAKGAEAKIKAEIAKTNTEINALYDNPRMEMNERQRAITKKRAHLAMLNRELEVEKGIAEDSAASEWMRNKLNPHGKCQKWKPSGGETIGESPGACETCKFNEDVTDPLGPPKAYCTKLGAPIN